ncbi:hypothetical protein AKJ09_11213 [Labilithrix luteola]|uniref:Lipoprotein n=1 Tax=Labilithrix luteola TaxID=1391654 RepID=A0A0K1QGI7_9BACT|nr:hypothetical protein [Labilithrix luteola]AKV04550.1 hypothetical protein AKJ09_11213 [Labilithrix luteola]
MTFASKLSFSSSRSRLASILGCLVVASSAVAVSFVSGCDDDPVTVRTRPDGGTQGTDAGSSSLKCGAVVSSVYDSPSFATNAAEELNLRAYAFAMDHKMDQTEGSNTAILTTAELTTAFTAGTPNLRSVSTAAAQAEVDGYLTAYGDAVGRVWTLAQAQADGGAQTGGKFESTFHVSATGLDLREATSRTLLGGAFYNHAVALAAGAMTEATVDRLVASFGATPAFANRTDEDAGADRDGLSASLASQRDDQSQSTGPYRRIRDALLTARAAAAAGDKCRDDLNQALSTFFAEWEKASYASAIYFLNLGSAAATAQPPKGPVALRAFGDAIGLIQSFRGVPQDRRKITDAQIDGLLAKIGADKAVDLLADTSNRTPSFVSAMQDIASLYGFTQSDVETFKKVF